ncbi:hypothetical protein ACE4Z6_26980, partial [Salmonella enterica]|uniref:hypothetical protein n=1 Tax=Salmonella enterica TaxID=28901 RepID=UPI003D2D1510
RAESWLRSMPVVVLTGIDDVRCVEESYRLGANSFVRKPADAGDFSEAVMMISMYWLLINRTAPNPIKV